VNRILMPYLNESATMLEQGDAIEESDKALLTFGMPMAAFILLRRDRHRRRPQGRGHPSTGTR